MFESNYQKTDGRIRYESTRKMCDRKEKVRKGYISFYISFKSHNDVDSDTANKFISKIIQSQVCNYY